jgi:hypothetical protein
MMERKYVILAPHVDDEVIGCYSLLQRGLVTDVYYFFDLTPERQKEAQKCAELFSFNPHFDGSVGKIPADRIVMVPNVHDNHTQHREIFYLAQKIQNEKRYYSVDMNNSPDVLNRAMAANKKDVLSMLFPSQSKLLEDEKYHLFEQLTSSPSRKFIWITFQKEGVHSYMNAPDDVSFLKNPHRHIFHFRVEIEVFHNEREVEFIMFKRELECLYSDGVLQLNNKSCEMIAEEIENYILINYPYRRYSITVSEDNENGATIKSGDF